MPLAARSSHSGAPSRRWILERRWFLGLVGAGVLSVPAKAAAQGARKISRVGVLTFTETAPALQDAFRQGLRDLGYVDGETIVVEWRAAGGRPDRARALAQELVRQKVDVLVADLTPAVQAVKDATTTIPIVMASAGDPVKTGFVMSLARPGGNITGLTGISAELSGKRIELLRELLPGLTRAGLLVNATNPFVKSLIAETREAATAAHIHLVVLDVRRAEDLAPAFAELAKHRAGAVIVDAALTPWEAASLALRHRVPSISNSRRFAESGGLMSHAAFPDDIYRRAASYVDKILKGAEPANLPVERPTRFELVLNLKTARALGLTIPPSLLARADQVIE